MINPIKAGAVALVLSLGLAAPGAAGPLENANAAIVRGDCTTALRLFRSLAEQGVAEAQWVLGKMYANGQGVPQDFTEATEWYFRAANQGHAEAQVTEGQLAMIAEPRDYAEALKWFGKAADQGNAEGQRELGLMYARGQGVPQDYAEAVRRVGKAADKGDSEAQFNLGLMYSIGQGVPQDYVGAYKWLNLAAARLQASNDRRSLAVKSRDTVARLMTPAQIAEAQRLAREWKPK
jgi:TPR repeat protein